VGGREGGIKTKKRGCVVQPLFSFVLKIKIPLYISIAVFAGMSPEKD
jgi:hypothetical protein